MEPLTPEDLEALRDLFKTSRTVPATWVFPMPQAQLDLINDMLARPDYYKADFFHTLRRGIDTYGLARGTWLVVQLYIRKAPRSIRRIA